MSETFALPIVTGNIMSFSYIFPKTLGRYRSSYKNKFFSWSFFCQSSSRTNHLLDLSVFPPNLNLGDFVSSTSTTLLALIILMCFLWFPLIIFVVLKKLVIFILIIWGKTYSSPTSWIFFLVSVGIKCETLYSDLKFVNSFGNLNSLSLNFYCRLLQIWYSIVAYHLKFPFLY